MNTIDDVNFRLGLGPDDRTLTASALDFDLSVFDLFGPLSVGGAVVVVAEADRREARTWLRLVREHRVTVWNTVPALFQMLTAVADADDRLPSLRAVMMSGDWIPLDLPDAGRRIAPDARYVSLGGATEASIWSNWFDIERIDPAWRSIPYGTPLANQQFRVVDDAGLDRPDWVAGELWIGGAGVALGYRGDPGRTAERFRTAGDGSRWYRTGDLARYWPDGTVEFLGRTDDQVKVGGHRIELAEVEFAVDSCPGVDAAVAFVTAPPLRTLAVAVAVAVQGETVTDEQVLAHAATQVPASMVPALVVRVTDWPLTANGKIDRRALQQLALASGSGPDDATPTEGLEGELAVLWRETLAVPAVPRHASLFALGGNSLHATEIVGRVRRRWDVDLTLRELMAAPTLAGVAAILTSRLGAFEEGEL